MIAIIWFMMGVLSTLAVEIAAVMGVVNAAQSDLGAARMSFAQALAEVGTRLDQFVAGVHLPF